MMYTFEKFEIGQDTWCFKPVNELSLPAFEKLDYCSWFKNPGEKLEVLIQTDKSSLEPSKKQVEVVHYILQNQDTIKHSIWEYYNNVVLPIYKVAIDINESDVALQIDELNKVFGLRTIEIPEFTYDKNYYLFQFDFRYDDEHGLYFLFEDDKVIDLFGEGDVNFDAVELYQNGMKDKNNKPIKYSISDLHGKVLFEGNNYDEEEIRFALKKGAYRAYTICNSACRTRNFFVSENIERFTLKELLANGK